MKNQDVTVGNIYEMRVSGRLVAVELLRECTSTVRLYSRSNMAPSYGTRRVRSFVARNLHTGRILPNPVKASRCRRQLMRRTII
jgi:hypothetical protein